MDVAAENKIQPIMQTTTFFSYPDTSKPPPKLPNSYGSFLYPKGTDRLNPTKPVWKQMSDINERRKETEEWFFKAMKLSNYKKIRSRFSKERRYCAICSEVDSVVFPEGKLISHTHKSTKMERIRSESTNAGSGLYN